MTDRPINPLDDDFLAAVTEDHTAINEEQSWTQKHKVKLGAYAPDGVFRLVVPAAYRKFPGAVYFTDLLDGGVGQCVNDRVAQYRNKVVWIGYPPGENQIWHVFRNDTGPEINPVTSQPGVQPHSEYHSLRNVGYNGLQTTGHVGSDILLVDDRQFWQGNIFPYSGFQARLTPGWYVFNGKLQFYNGAILADQTANVPAGAGDAAWVLVELDKDETLTYTKGTEFKWATQNNQTDYVPRGSDNTYKWALLVRNGDTSFTYACIWTGLHLRQVNGLVRTAIAASSNTSGPGIYEIDTSGGAYTLTLDSDDAVDGREIIVKDTAGNANANNITIDTEGAETIDGAASQTISTDYGYMRVYSDGTDWYIIG